MMRIARQFSQQQWTSPGLKMPNCDGVLKSLGNTKNIFTYIRSELKGVEASGQQMVDISFTVQEPIRPMTGVQAMEVDPVQVFWYPRNEQQLDQIGWNLIDIQEDVNMDSPQFKDTEYRKRREMIAAKSRDFKIGQPLPTVDYSRTQTDTWKNIYGKLRQLHKDGMCESSVLHLNELHDKLNLAHQIPQLGEIDAYLQQKTKFGIKPTLGIVSQREFLNAFAFRRFCCTQYIRHHSIPEYTPEPDIVHEIVGHVPMFADQSIADFSQEIGLLSLGATDEQISALGSLYWFTIEFGAVLQKGQYKGYGAGIGSSIGEIEHLMSGKAGFKKLDLRQDSVAPYTIQDIQEVYRYVDDLGSMQADLKAFGRTFKKQTNMAWNQKTKQIETDRQVTTIATP